MNPPIYELETSDELELLWELTESLIESGLCRDMYLVINTSTV